MPLNDETNLKRSRRTCSPEHGLQSCQRDWAGVAKRPREAFTPTQIPSVTIRNFFSHRCTPGDGGTARKAGWCMDRFSSTKRGRTRHSPTYGTSSKRRSFVRCPPPGAHAQRSPRWSLFIVLIMSAGTQTTPRQVKLPMLALVVRAEEVYVCSLAHPRVLQRRPSSTTCLCVSVHLPH
jgi:hypothetical protein